MIAEKFKCRASKAGILLTNPRSKSEVLSKTVQSYCEEWVKTVIYGHEKEVKSKYLEKGKLLEDESIRLYSQYKNGLFLLKNDQRFENEFFTGEPDVDDEIIYDFKNSWDAFTFPLFDEEADPDHVAQVNVYMNLTGKTQAKVVYTLQNTPESMHYVQQFDYSAVDVKYRIREFDVAYNEELIKTLEERVLLCREYIASITKNL